MSRIEALADHSVNCILSNTSRIKTKLPAHLEYQTSARFTSLRTFKRDKTNVYELQSCLLKT